MIARNDNVRACQGRHILNRKRRSKIGIRCYFGLVELPKPELQIERCRTRLAERSLDIIRRVLSRRFVCRDAQNICRPVDLSFGFPDPSYASELAVVAWHRVKLRQLLTRAGTYLRSATA